MLLNNDQDFDKNICHKEWFVVLINVGIVWACCAVDRHSIHTAAHVSLGKWLLNLILKKYWPA